MLKAFIISCPCTPSLELFTVRSRCYSRRLNLSGSTSISQNNLKWKKPFSLSLHNFLKLLVLFNNAFAYSSKISHQRIFSSLSLSLCLLLPSTKIHWMRRRFFLIKFITMKEKSHLISVEISRWNFLHCNLHFALEWHERRKLS